MEILSGAKPGRPALAIVTAALALVLALALAWVQMRGKSALQPAVSIPGTPLTIRAPRQWVPVNDEPGVFLLPAPAAMQRRGVAAEYTKRLEFRYERRRHFDLPIDGAALEPCRIGDYPAAQVRLRRMVRRNLAEWIVRRVAVSPRGDVITIELVTLTGITHGDLSMLDDVAAAVRLDAAGAYVPFDDALARAGVALSDDYPWTASVAEDPLVPNAYIGSQTRRLPAWSIGLLRTWLATGRTPERLLEDFAAVVLDLRAVDYDLDTTERADGLRTTRLRPRQLTTLPLCEVWVVSRGPAEALLMPVYAAAPWAVDAATDAAERVAGALTFTGPGPAPDVAAAESAGADLARHAQEFGPQTWMTAGRFRRYLLAQSVGGTEAWLLDRQPTTRSGARFSGAQVVLRARGDTVERWEYERDGAYLYTRDDFDRDEFGRFIVNRRWSERRRASGAPVERLTVLGGRESASRFAPGPNYLFPPLVFPARQRVARQTDGAALVETSLIEGPDVCTLLLRPLPPDAQGRARLLEQTDFFPVGSVVVLDELGDLVGVASAGYTLAETTRPEVEARFPRLAEWEARLGSP
jgi:hypothetical protein